LPSLLPSPQALGSFDLAVCMGDTLTHLQVGSEGRWEGGKEGGREGGGGG
jgi:hypothetical protein